MKGSRLLAAAARPRRCAYMMVTLLVTITVMAALVLVASQVCVIVTTSARQGRASRSALMARLRLQEQFRRDAILARNWSADDNGISLELDDRRVVYSATQREVQRLETPTTSASATRREQYAVDCTAKFGRDEVGVLPLAVIELPPAQHARRLVPSLRLEAALRPATPEANE